MRDSRIEWKELQVRRQTVEEATIIVYGRDGEDLTDAVGVEKETSAYSKNIGEANFEDWLLISSGG